MNAILNMTSALYSFVIKTFVLLNSYNTKIVADIDDTEVIWIALLRHAGKTLFLPEDRTNKTQLSNYTYKYRKHHNLECNVIDLHIQYM